MAKRLTREERLKNIKVTNYHADGTIIEDMSKVVVPQERLEAFFAVCQRARELKAIEKE